MGQGQVRLGIDVGGTNTDVVIMGGQQVLASTTQFVNAPLSPLARRVVTSFVQAFADLSINAPIYISQNHGTLISTEMAMRYPILTCAAGPTNSIRGAAFLTGLTEAIVVDIAGTTSDIGLLLNNFPRETTTANYIGGVRTNFRMPGRWT
ncbi:hydantoinase/oxoprolinase family protein [Niveispirillum irakense]|uniref:hydantoinase/oxoprolinase family protein n=1 Tax=Niveispirillum irakense TaxID=34011 RepID=UPI00040789ED|nr:hydantoinase/oxoprolinase family protein [Niveispirillum irakense]